ncbi:hypothetical protein M3Y99_00349400 [Aphelenchoides fujianensis]|nr:hypothetical protein M3Y99_00349400 [Aphelenchoides fujianensis]
MDTIRNIARNVYDDLAPLASEGKLFVEKLGKTNYGQDLLARQEEGRRMGDQLLPFRYKLSLYQSKQLNQKTMRMSNLTSTRMSALQQRLNEDWEAVQKLDALLNRMPAVVSQLEDVQKQMSELHRYCLQTEISIAALDQTIERNNRQGEIVDLN